MVLCQWWGKAGLCGSPDLFICVIDHLMTWVFQRITGVSLGNYHLIDQEYADDTTLFSDTAADLVAGLSIFQEEASKFGLQVSWEKTKLIHVGDGADPPPIVIVSTTIDFFFFLDSFNYLKSFFVQVILAERLRDAVVLPQPSSNHFGSHSGDKNSISCQTKLCIYNVLVLLVLHYGSETWPINQSLAKN